MACDDAQVMMPGTPHRPDQSPGLFPLRPLSIGEILLSSVRVAWTHLGLLAPVALLIGILTTGTNLAILAGYGELRNYASQTWANVPAHPDDAWVRSTLNSLGHILVGTGGLLAVSLVVSPILVGLASSCAARSAIFRGADYPGVLRRLRGRWLTLVGAGALAGLLTVAGFIALIVPGILLWLALLPTGPVAALEGARPVAALRRAAALSRGFRARLLGVTLLAGLFAGIAGVLAGAVLGSVFSSTDVVRTLLVAQAVGVLVGAFTSAWSTTVTAMLYIDLRMRREGLADSLRHAAYQR